MAGRAMLAIAVSSEAIASAVKIAAMAHRLRSQGKPSVTGPEGGLAVVTSVGISSGSPDRMAMAPQAAGTPEKPRPPAVLVHDAYAIHRPGHGSSARLRCQLSAPGAID